MIESAPANRYGVEFCGRCFGEWLPNAPRS